MYPQFGHLGFKIVVVCGMMYGFNYAAVAIATQRELVNSVKDLNRTIKDMKKN